MPWEALAKWLGGIVVAVLGWLGLDTYKRVRALEENKVTREDLDELRSSMIATFSNGHERIEQRLDKIWERLSQ